MTEIIKIIAKAPQGPGVYKFLDKTGVILYVGKAKDLRKRLQSYVRPSAKHAVRTTKMLEDAVSVEWVETNSEVEALILEDNFIKQNQPKFNVLLKDNKTYQYFKITVQNDYPEVITVRKIEKDGAKYIGPKTNGTDVQRILESVKRIFRLCSLRNITLNPEGEILKGAKVAVKVGGTVSKRPCLDYHIKRCTGPCAGMVTPQEYRKQIDGALEFLTGHYQKAIESLKFQMNEYAVQKKFERAASLRDQIAAVQRSAEKQLITDTKLEDRDITAYVEDLGKNYFVLFRIREGKLIDQEQFISEGGDSPAEVMEAFLTDYYSRAADIPKEVVISIEVKEAKLLEEYISKQADKKVKLICPQAGKKDQLIQLAEKNARSFATQSRVRWMAESKGEKALEDLQKALKLKSELKRIECYDISHLGGTETIGSMVVFKKGEPASADYRQFRLRSTAFLNDDFKSMEEVMNRRLNYLPARLTEDYEIRKMKKQEQASLEDITDLTFKDFYVILHKKKIVARGSLKHLSDKVDRIKYLLVDEKESGKKLGYFIMKKLIEHSKQKRVYLACIKELEEYYLKMGWETLREAPKELTEEKNEKKPIYMAYQKKKPDLSFTSIPDLIVIDGGKGQLSSAYKVLTDKGLKIPMISLAKKEEEVYLPDKSEPIDLPNNTEASYLLQRLRDEAHRFAIGANRSSRDKKMTKSALDNIPGVGPKIRKKLLTYFGSTHKIQEASQVQLEQIVGEELAKRIKESLGA